MMNIDENKKIDVLVSALEERYKSIHIIRERVQNIGIWALGLLLGIGGWLLQSEVILANRQKAFIVLGLLATFVTLRFVYLTDLFKGFKSQQRVAAHLEKILGFYEPGIFESSSEPIYPKNWENAGIKDAEGNFFGSTYALLYVGFAFIIIAILINGISTKELCNLFTAIHSLITDKS